jgi:hypothetical protein
MFAMDAFMIMDGIGAALAVIVSARPRGRSPARHVEVLGGPLRGLPLGNV